MTAVSIIKELRSITGAGIMDCKKALKEANGDIKKSVQIIRNLGKVNIKRQRNKSLEGLVSVKFSSSKAVIVEINSESDFVSRNQVFVDFVEEVSDTILKSQKNSDFLSFKLGNSDTVIERCNLLSSKFGEKINVRRVKTLSAGRMHGYNYRGKIGTIFGTNKDFINDPLDSIVRLIGSHIVASNPLSISEKDFPTNTLEEQKKLYLEQSLKIGKDQSMVKRIVEGRIQKFLNENTLLNQKFFSDQTKNVSQILKNYGVSITEFSRFSVGEPILDME